MLHGCSQRCNTVPNVVNEITPDTAHESEVVYNVSGGHLDSLISFRCYPLAEYGTACNCGFKAT
jgi:hypothetical protein